MDRLNRAATINIDTPHGFDPRLRFEFFDSVTGLPLDLTGRLVVLEIYENNMASVYAADSGVGGAITINGNIVDVVIAKAVEEHQYYHEVIKESPPKQYRYRLDVDEDIRLQGAWRSLIRAGAVMDQQDLYRVDVGAVSVHVAVASIQSGRAADAVRIMTATGPITLLDDTVLIRAGTGTISAALPDPASVFGGGASVPVVLLRPADDNSAGSVTITGIGPELPEVLFPGESLWLQSDGSAWQAI